MSGHVWVAVLTRSISKRAPTRKPVPRAVRIHVKGITEHQIVNIYVETLNLRPVLTVDLFLIYDYFQVVCNQINTSNKAKFVQNKYILE